MSEPKDTVKSGPVRRAEAILEELEAEMKAHPMNLIDPLCIIGLLRYVATGEQVVTSPAIASERHNAVRAYLRGGGRFGTVFMHIGEADTSEVTR
jgi:hypothetical protein